MFDSVSQQHTIGSVGVEVVTGFDDAHRKGVTNLLRDLLETRRAIEGLGDGFLHGQPGFGTDGQEVDDGSETIRPVLLAESTREPQAGVGATNPRPGFVDRASSASTLVLTGDTTELLEFVDTEDRATQRTGATRSRDAGRFSRHAMSLGPRRSSDSRDHRDAAARSRSRDARST